MDAHFTKKIGTVRTTIIHYGPQDGRSSQSTSSNQPITRSLSAPNSFGKTDTEAMAFSYQQTYESPHYMTSQHTGGTSPGLNQSEHIQEMIINPTTGLETGTGSGVIYSQFIPNFQQMALPAQENDSHDIHYTNTYSVAANQNILVPPVPETRGHQKRFENC